MNKETFKATRKARNLTQDQLGQFLRVSGRQVKRYENGFCAIPGPVGLIMESVGGAKWPKRPTPPPAPRKRLKKRKK